ncbi:Scr1 family TA system antitoxin-like transcriptional regulator [Streptomyces sp. NPDC127074]|uniref:helix-turn-helix domain-containing protein n=1 Tax=Streptomyces sp. NPDC127074 TaxID=3347130 RepID=UPI003666C88B
MSIESEHADPADPTVSPLAHFGAEVRLERERLCMSREDLGAEAHCGYSLVAKIEAGKRVPMLEFAEACDRMFPHSNGRFVRLWPLALRYAFPPWFRRYVEFERDAATIRTFESQVIPGLLQTTDYARALLRTGRPDSLDDLVTARMTRQSLWERDSPPRAWFVLDEQALHRNVGGAEVMACQLQRLLKAGQEPRTVIQVVPQAVGAHPGLAGPFTILSFGQGPDVLYVDSFSEGRTVLDAAEVDAAAHAYDLLRSYALSPEASAEVIGARLEELSP